jgi:hypothetical protein
MLAALHGGGHHALRILAAAASNSWIESTNSKNTSRARPSAVHQFSGDRFPGFDARPVAISVKLANAQQTNLPSGLGDISLRRESDDHYRFV